MLLRARLYAVVESIVDVNPHEISALIHSSLCFFFVRSDLMFLLFYSDFGFIFNFLVSDLGCDGRIILKSQLLSAYFVILPLRDDGAISLGLGNLPELFVGSLVLTLVAAPVSTVVFSLPSLSKGKVRRILILIFTFLRYVHKNHFRDEFKFFA